ncbi:MAG: DUF6242 domain-containing protein [Porphyromonadaceae bacterium]|nr:DUF6242 domain-containing protein [Porphyromonadaceae bacterium]
MISKYFLLAWLTFLNLLLLSSCLNSNVEDTEYSPDAQIYAFSLSSAADTSDILSSTKFTIDQVNGKIFNKDPLPYLFRVDSVLLNIAGASTYSPYALVQLMLDPDSTYNWVQDDSVATTRLKKITTTAPDGITKKSYDFQLNIYQEDPYLLRWEQKSPGYLPVSVVTQKTIALKNRFITYFNSGTAIQAKSTDSGDGADWTTETLSGLPPTLQLSSLMTVNDTAYGLDATTGTVYQSTDGASWNKIVTTHTIKAIYGEMPQATHGNILAAAEINGVLTFVQTDNFSVLKPLNNLPANMPLKDFSATKVDTPTSYSKYLILSGGITSENKFNNNIWILLENNGVITYVLSRIPGAVSVNGSSLFFYDNKPYLMTTSSGENILMYSNNSGLDWIKTAENQSFPSGFTLRINASVLTDAANYMWIFGGISAAQTPLADVWKGRLSKYAFN